MLNAAVLLAGGLSGAALLTLLHVPAGALLGAVAGSMAVNGLTGAVASARAPAGSSPTRRTLPRAVRIVGQVLLGVLAGARLDEASLQVLLSALVPVAIAAIVLIGTSLVAARYLFSRYRVDPLTAVMATAPGGVSELASVAEERGAAMHVVMAVHLLRVLLVVLVALPIAVLVVGGA